MQLSRSLVALLLVFLSAHAASASIVHARQDSGDTALTSSQPTAERTSTARNTAELSSEPTATATNDEASSVAPSGIESRTRASAKPSTTAAVSTTALTDVPSAAVASDAATASSTGELSCSHVQLGLHPAYKEKETPSILATGYPSRPNSLLPSGSLVQFS